MNWVRTENHLPEHDGWYLCWMYYGGWDKLFYWSDYGVFAEDARRFMKEDEHRAFEEGEVLFWAEVEEPEDEEER